VVLALALNSELSVGACKEQAPSKLHVYLCLLPNTVNISNFYSVSVGLKSHMAQQRAQAKKEAEKGGGGGSAGLKSRTESKIGLSCEVCKAAFQSVKMKQQLKDHYMAKHQAQGKTFNDCFPGEVMI
jgi:hypothetical protein